MKKVSRIDQKGSERNDIGVMGAAGAGVGIYPDTLPGGMRALEGTADRNHAEYGNYQFSDGSVMVWIPAFYYKIGTGRNELPINRIDIRPFHAFASVMEAATAGYALHRAFHDGGVRTGFFIDKYLCSNNQGIASSVQGGAPLSTYERHNPISALCFKPTNAYHGTVMAVKTRGSDFFVASQFQRAALAMLALAHAQAANCATCAWFDPEGRISFPKGCNNGDLGDMHDASIAYEPDGYSNCGLTGSGTPFAKTTHNGQTCGVADLNGLLWEVSPGLTAALDTGRHFVLAPSARMKDMAGGDGDGAHDLWGTEEQLLRAGYEPVSPASATVLSEATSGAGWRDTGLGIPQRNASRWVKPFDLRDPNGLCPLAGGHWANGAGAGVWTLYLSHVRGDSNDTVGFRAALYL